MGAESREYTFSISESESHLVISDPAGDDVITINKYNGKIWIRSGDDAQHKFVWMPDEADSGDLYELCVGD